MRKKIGLSLMLALPVSCFTTSIYAVKCADFDTQADAQDYYKAGKKGSKRLDGDKDGEACECLPGGSNYGESVCRRWRKKYGK